MNVIEANGLGKRYGGTWALRECTLAVPAGHVAALAGPNGAGKTTLLKLAVGLAAPSAGAVTVLGGRTPGSPAALDGIAFVAQDTPLYKNLPAADMLHLTRNLNRRFDRAYAEARLAELGIPLNRKAGRLSGGQQAQLALTLALARRPRLLVLDEPVAMLDPVARHDFMATVLTAGHQQPQPARLRVDHQPAVADQGRPAGQPVRAQPGPPGGTTAHRERRGPEVPQRDAVPHPARLHAVDQLPAGQPVLAIPVDRGRLAARAVGAADRRDRLGGPPPRRLNIMHVHACRGRARTLRIILPPQGISAGVLLTFGVDGQDL